MPGEGRDVSASGDPAAAIRIRMMPNRRRPRHPLRCTSFSIKDLIMSEAEQYTRRALQESMDLRDQGHSDD